MDQKFEKWDRWIETIYKETVNLVEHQQIFEEVQNIIKANPNIQKQNAFYRFLEDTYAAFSAMGIRRQIKIEADGSLVGLLTEIIQCPSVLSRERFVELYSADMQSGASQIFDERFSGSCTNHIDPTLVQRDLDEFKEHGRKVEKYADKRIAHRDKKEPTVPIFAELNPPINCLKELVIKYYFLIKTTDLENCFVPPFLNEFEMEVIFREPWILSNGETDDG